MDVPMTQMVATMTHVEISSDKYEYKDDNNQGVDNEDNEDNDIIWGADDDDVGNKCSSSGTCDKDYKIVQKQSLHIVIQVRAVEYNFSKRLPASCKVWIGKEHPQISVKKHLPIVCLVNHLKYK